MEIKAKRNVQRTASFAPFTKSFASIFASDLSWEKVSVEARHKAEMHPISSK